MNAQRPLCLCCGVVIGVYEPVIVIEHKQARRTSLGREPELARRASTLLFAHSGCAPPDWHDGEWAARVPPATGSVRRPESSGNSAPGASAARAIGSGRLNGAGPAKRNGRPSGRPPSAAANGLTADSGPRTIVSGSGVSLLDADPELRRSLNGNERAAASRMMLPIHTIAAARSDIAALLAEASVIGLFVVEGMLSQRLRIGDQLSLRLLGPGDLCVSGQPRSALPIRYGCIGTAATKVALLDQKLLSGACRWPGITAGLLRRMAQQTEASAVHLAIAQLPRANDRLLAIMALLAGRWGQVTSDGTMIPLALTHASLGELIGSSRPTVTIALSHLARHGHLLKHDHGWLLPHQPRDAGQNRPRSADQRAPHRHCALTPTRQKHDFRNSPRRAVATAGCV
jgi:CRP/FNR family transcriptional regulator, cyclic AMP receptor protein